MSNMVVADLYKLGRIDGNQFDKDIKKLERKSCKITKQWMEQTNSNWIDTGRIYVVNDKATEEYLEKSKEQVQEREAKKHLKATTDVNSIGKAFETIANMASNQQTKEVEKSEDRSALEEKAKELDVKFRSNISDIKLLAKINEVEPDFKLD